MTDASTPNAALLGPPQDHCFLSPHYDDIALSCGGTVALLAAAGRGPTIVVVFGDQPAADLRLSPFARAMHESWGLAAAEVIGARRREEAAAAAALGATSRVLPFFDAIYRGDTYTSDDELFGPTAAAEHDLPSQIAAAATNLSFSDGQPRFYAPLGIGGHVDHQHVFAAGLRLARAGQEVWFYEDLPYAIRDGALQDRLTSFPRGLDIIAGAAITIDAVWETKLDAILAYPSQMAPVFRYVGTGNSRREIDTAMRSYAKGRGGAQAVEQYWRLAP